jgi:hypothetical protein
MGWSPASVLGAQETAEEVLDSAEEGWSAERQAGFLTFGHGHQMQMVGHQAVRPDPHAVLARVLPQQAQTPSGRRHRRKRPPADSPAASRDEGIPGQPHAPPDSCRCTTPAHATHAKTRKPRNVRSVSEFPIAVEPNQ